MRPDTPPTIHLKDYAPVPFAVRHVDLLVRLHETETYIVSQLSVEPLQKGAVLQLHGEELALHGVRLDGEELPESSYNYADGLLTFSHVPWVPFTLEIIQSCNPKANTQLSGLYLTNNVFCTQMEAEGFRRFAFMYDRPDVMATYRVRIEAPKSFPVLLANGNPLGGGDIGDDRHFAIWDDPHPKPTYLFALVAGDLAAVHGVFTTMSGRQVRLGIYVERGKEDRCGWALQCLKESMRWDQERFGREYDLDVFNIVAVSDFNMGAMENKGLNIFNDKYILARPDTATDTDYLLIETIIAHEYFHNWTGNRITCRDWFQLCLKEGLTVFRDQEFTSDIRSRAVKRIQDVRTLRARQVPEDQGPLAHPVRPSSYMEINNFYTPTVYEKGAEICRMLHTLLGEQQFRAAMDLYFQRHDGQAATVEDFIACMADASGRDLTHFSRWYEQAGTPQVSVSSAYDEASGEITLSVRQTTPPTAGQLEKFPLHMPLGIGLIGPDGNDLPLELEGFGILNEPLLELTREQQDFTFKGLRARPVVSINRGFTAPVTLTTDASDADLLFQMGHDSDTFNRWEAAQTLSRSAIIKAVRRGVTATGAGGYAAALGRTLRDPTLDNAFKAAMLALPPEAEIAASLGGDADSDAVFAGREAVRQTIATHIIDELIACYQGTESREPYAPDTTGIARRALRYGALYMIAANSPGLALRLAKKELAAHTSMTAQLSAISAVSAADHPDRDAMLRDFYENNKGDHLLVDKWFMLNAHIPGPDSFRRIEALIQHPAFTYDTPNRVYALLAGFTGGNLTGFNAAHGEGYRVIADAIIKIDVRNPQVAARLATGFRSWRIYDAARREKAQQQLERIVAVKQLSRDTYEIVSKTLRS